MLINPLYTNLETIFFDSIRHLGRKLILFFSLNISLIPISSYLMSVSLEKLKTKITILYSDPMKEDNPLLHSKIELYKETRKIENWK